MQADAFTVSLLGGDRFLMVTCRGCSVSAAVPVEHNNHKVMLAIAMRAHITNCYVAPNKYQLWAARRIALMGAGNGVTQPVAEWVGRRIVAAERSAVVEGQEAGQ